MKTSRGSTSAATSPDAQQPAELVVRGLRAGYAGTRVLDGVDLDVATGEVLAVLGRNGMGKSTLVNSIAGLRPPEVTAGTCEFNGVDMFQVPAHQVARHGIGLVPQGRRVFPSLNVVENLTTTARQREGGWTIDGIFELFPRLAERRNHGGKQLSGGEQQMLAVGRALMTNPALLLMDEPTEGLAPVVIGQIADKLRQLKGSLAMLLVEQNAGFALAVADRVVIMDTGRIVWTGPAAELEADEATQRRFLGVGTGEDHH